MSRQTYFEVPTQVRFFEPEDGDYIGGIAYCGEIICGCCGSAIDIEDLYERVRDAAADGECTPSENEVIQPLSWVPINQEILGDDFYSREIIETTTEPPRAH